MRREEVYWVTMNVEETFSQIKFTFHFDFELKKQQKTILDYVCSGTNVFSVLPTGFGKSLAFILAPLLQDQVSHSQLFQRRLETCIIKYESFCQI